MSKFAKITLNPHQRWGILGRNGSGKSTFAAQLARQWNATLVSFETEHALLEHEIRNDDSESLDRIDFGRTVRELLAEAAPNSTQILPTAAQLGLTPLLDQGFLTLSTGERRRLILARALLTPASALILDEPFDGLDQDFRQPLQELLKTKTFVLITNRWSDLDNLVSHFALLENGLITHAAPIEKNTSQNLIEHYFNLQNEPKNLPTRPPTTLPPGPLAELTNVTVAYASKTILKNFHWTIEPNQNWKISGPNGCGKTTLVHLITGDHPQCYSNNIRIFGKQRGTGESIWDLKKLIGIVSTHLHQQYRLDPNALSVVLSGFFDSIGLYHQPTPTQIHEAKLWLDLLGMTPWAHRSFRSLSYGQQRLLLIARALVKQPPLLVLDEPCQGLDPLNRQLVLRVIDRILATKITQVLYITHEPDDHLTQLTHHLKFTANSWEMDLIP